MADSDINDYCDTCDNEHWLPNDQPDADEHDSPWLPCPWCNKYMRFPNPYIFVIEAAQP